jgi:hypothetical protein
MESMNGEMEMRNYDAFLSHFDFSAMTSLERGLIVNNCLPHHYTLRCFCLHQKVKVTSKTSLDIKTDYLMIFIDVIH